MAARTEPDLIQEFLGSAHVFSSALRKVVEERTLEELAGQRVTFGLFRLLSLVARADAQSIGDVAAFLGVSNTAASNAVDKLVRRRLLRRTEVATDRRAIQLSLTEKGRRLVAAYEKARDEKVAAAFGDCPPARLRRTAETLDRLSASLVDHTASSEEVCLQCGIYFREKCLVRQLVHRNCFYLQNRRRRVKGKEG